MINFPLSKCLRALPSEFFAILLAIGNSIYKNHTKIVIYIDSLTIEVLSNLNRNYPIAVNKKKVVFQHNIEVYVAWISDYFVFDNNNKVDIAAEESSFVVSVLFVPISACDIIYFFYL